jgi:hypothetical protein
VPEAPLLLVPLRSRSELLLFWEESLGLEDEWSVESVLRSEASWWDWYLSWSLSLSLSLSLFRSDEEELLLAEESDGDWRLPAVWALLSLGLVWEFDAEESPDVLPAEAERSVEPGAEEDAPALLLLPGVDDEAEEFGSVDELDADEPGVDDDETPLWLLLSDVELPTELEVLSPGDADEPDWTDDDGEDDLSLLTSSSARDWVGEKAKVSAVVATASVRMRS